MATQQPAAAQQGPIDNDVIQEWSQRANDVLAQPGEVINSKSPADAEPWHANLFACFMPVDLCLTTWCLPCVTFGKTHHRLRKNGNLEGYEPVNTSCLLFLGSSFVALTGCMMAMQRQEVREKYRLQGSCLSDLAISCCCGCCSLVQQDKEVEHRQGLLGGAVKEQYQAQGSMEFPVKQ